MSDKEKLFETSALSVLTETVAKPNIKSALDKLLKQRQVVIDLVMAELKSSSNKSAADAFLKSTAIAPLAIERMKSLGKTTSEEEVHASIKELSL